MTLSSMQFVLLNTTTIENLSRHTKVWSLASYMPPSSVYPAPLGFNTITYPLGYVYPNQDDLAPQPPQPQASPRVFAILHSKPGENIWDLGYWRNFKSVMGERWYDWFLPVKYSPCCRHDQAGSHFEMGPVFDRMRKEAGIHFPYDTGKPGRRRRKKRRIRRTVLSEERAARSSRRSKKREKEVELTDIESGDPIVR